MLSLFVRIVSWIISVSALISILPGLGMLMMSPMIFDAPGSGQNVLVWMLFFAVWTHPVAVISGAMIIFNNKARSIQRYFVGVGVTLVPLALAVISFLAIDIFCEGGFSC